MHAPTTAKSVPTKRILRRYNGIDKNDFHSFLKEYEFRFNYGTFRPQLKILGL